MKRESFVGGITFQILEEIATIENAFGEDAIKLRKALVQRLQLALVEPVETLELTEYGHFVHLIIRYRDRITIDLEKVITVLENSMLTFANILDLEMMHSVLPDVSGPFLKGERFKMLFEKVVEYEFVLFQKHKGRHKVQQLIYIGELHDWINVKEIIEEWVRRIPDTYFNFFKMTIEIRDSNSEKKEEAFKKAEQMKMKNEVIAIFKSIASDPDSIILDDGPRF